MPCYRICSGKIANPQPLPDYNKMGPLRKWWENLDLKILLLYILISQLYLHFFGRFRRKSTSRWTMIVNVWLLYLFSDLLATIALGKLSKVNVKGDDDINMKPPTNITNGKPKVPMPNPPMGEEALRVMWAPLILFYLGGPDTMTVLRVEENKLWVRHFIGLLTQGLRTAYVLTVTWSMKAFSLPALVILIPGVIKYGERVLVVWLNSHTTNLGFFRLDSNETEKFRDVRSNSEQVLQAYSWFQALMPHCQDYNCDKIKVGGLVTKFRESIGTGRPTFDAFRLIEVELGLIYDRVFSKLGTIFTVWGSILRFLSFSIMVSVLVVFLLWDKPPQLFKGDYEITIVLLAGAIFLDLAGIVAQLLSDWALVWACKNRRSALATPVLFLHENLIPVSRQRWSGAMGQFSLREFCTKDKPPVWNKTWEYLFGRERMLKKFSSQKSIDLVPRLKDLVINGVKEISEKAIGVDTFAETSNANVDKAKLPTSGLRRGEWTLVSYNLEQQFQLEFGRSIVIWHAATEVYYRSDQGNDEVKREAVKVLSDYMMYLLVVCPHRFPFCNKYDKITEEEEYANMKKLLEGGELELVRPDGQKGVGKEGNTKDIDGKLENISHTKTTRDITLVNKARCLVLELEKKTERWDIMASMWVEMMCYAAWKCPVKNHIQELPHGGEFLTHVWLLLMHFGVPKELERSHSSRKDEYDSAVKTKGDFLGGIEDKEVERNQYDLQATDDELDQNDVGGWDVTHLEI